MHWVSFIRLFWVLYFLVVAIVAGFTVVAYKGSGWVYLIFTFLSVAVFYLGFGRGSIFFDAFLGVLLWVGFWLKFSVRTAFSNGQFNISVGAFDGSPEALDQTLLVVCCALSAILLVRLIRSRIFNYPVGLPGISYVGIFEFYCRYRFVLLSAFVLVVLFVCVTNAYYGIYQRGLVARLNLPYGLNGVYAWLLMFGMASVSAIILRFEFELNRERYWIAITVALLEVMLSNISLWSRGMILNGSSLLFGAITLFRRTEPRPRVGLVISTVLLFACLFVVSVVSVNYLRANTYYVNAKEHASMVIKEQTTVLFLDRWVGVEGVMSVVGAKEKGWDIFKQAVFEKFDFNKTSFYDSHFGVSNYDNTKQDGLHFVSLPGYIAFLFYPGSFLFLFFSVMVFSMVAALLELAVYYFGGKNLVFCALIAQVIAFRFTSFGYVPLQSYLLFGSIFLNILIFLFFDKVLRVVYRP